MNRSQRKFVAFALISQILLTVSDGLFLPTLFNAKEQTKSWSSRRSARSNPTKFPGVEGSRSKARSAKESDEGCIKFRCGPMDRRTAIVLPVSFAFLGGAMPSQAAESNSILADLMTGQADSARLENGLLESRVQENVLSPPPYGMEGADVFYPAWLGGSWNVYSITTDVQAPCGVQFFGGNNTFLAAKSEIGPEHALRYESRFIPDGSGRIVADREFNVKSIAKVTLGANSVVDVSLASPMKFSCLLSPTGSPFMLAVDLIVLNRRQEDVDDNNFHCSEVVREIVSVVGESSGAPRRTPLLKEIETASLYSIVPPLEGQPVTEVHCRQRSATFLLPSQQDPMALKMWEMSRGRPIDVRFYDVVYTKR